MKPLCIVALITFCLIISGCDKSANPPDIVKKDIISESSELKEKQDEIIEDEETPLPTESEKEPESEDYKYINDFIAKYNSTATNAITDISIIDATDYNGGHYNKDIAHTFVSNSVRAKFGYIGDSNLEIISYYTHYDNSLHYTIRLNCNTNTKEVFEQIISTSAKILDESLSNDEINKLLDNINKYTGGSHLYVGEKVNVKYEKDAPGFWFEMESNYATEKIN